MYQAFDLVEDAEEDERTLMQKHDVRGQHCERAEGGQRLCVVGPHRLSDQGSCPIAAERPSLLRDSRVYRSYSNIPISPQVLMRL
jgi:hypothetical protein